MKSMLVFAMLSAAPNLQAIVDEMRVRQQVPGVAAVVTRSDGVVFAGASGVADIVLDRPMSPDTPLYIGSVSKVLTAVLALQLVESGTVTLDDAVPGIALQSGQVVRIGDLLTHASGLVREGDFGYWFSGEFPDAGELDRYLAETNLRSSPGEELHYSNIGYAALGRVIEKAHGKSFGEVLRTQLAVPLGMTSTGAPGPATGIANGYTPSGRLIPGSERPFAGVGEKVGERHERSYHNAAAMSPAFGIYASASDMGRLARFLLGHGNETVLATEMRSAMRETQPSGWGLGLKLQRHAGREVARHDGWFAAHRSHLLLNATDDIGIVVLTNGDNANARAIANALHDALIEGI